MRCLELFAGTGSVGDVFRNAGWEVVSLDRDLPADIQTDILDWDYKEFEPGAFDVIWASPPCTEYSIAKTIGTRKIEEANKVSLRTLDIIDYLRPKYWMIENPQTGYLKAQSFMDNRPYNDLDYCRYGMPYRKRTRLWNNLLYFHPLLCNKQCNMMTEDRRKHIHQAQHSPSKDPPEDWPHEVARFRTTELYRIPRLLTEYIVECIERQERENHEGITV
jgi:hypothetical protein